MKTFAALGVILTFKAMMCLRLISVETKSWLAGKLLGSKASSRHCGAMVPRSPNSQLQATLAKQFQQMGNAVLAIAVSSSALGGTRAVASPLIEPFPEEGYKTGSGLIYFDLPSRQPPDNTTSTVYPAYGQFVSFYFASYYMPSVDANGKLEFIDSTELGAPYLQKHGNGRVIRGIEEALHTMTVGSRRRALIPAQLGYAKFGLGPLPVDPSRRRKLGEAIGKVDRGEGSLVYDLELVHIRDDENDMGYYSDIPVTREEVRDYVFKAKNITMPTRGAEPRAR
jgi:peptidylprolyl isomerase